MRTAIAIGVLLGVLQGFAAQERGRFTVVGQTCISQLNLNKQEIEAVFKNDSIYFPENDVNFSEFIGCYWKKTGYLDADGVINYNRLIQLLKNFPRERFGASPGSGNLGLELATAGIEGCKSTPQGNSRGETAVRFQNCVTKYVEEYLKNVK